MDNAVRPISIHALREEGDLRRHRLPQTAANHFYPRPPRGGRPAGVRRAVVADVISIRALREEGDRPQAQVQSKADNFYPRPPRGGRPACASMSFITVSPFLSTPSARRATVRQSRLSGSHQISIHALREEGDTSTRSMTTSTSYFYPRPPRGGRHRRSGKKTIQKHFYPRPPRGGRQSGRAGNNPDKRFLSTPSARRATMNLKA